MPSNERDALIAALNDDTAAAHIYPSTLKTFQRGEHGGECWSIKVGNEDEESVGVFTVQQVIDALAATAPNAGAPLAEAWIPTADSINALPQPVRDYIHALETNADPAGMVRENAQLKDANEAVQRMYRRAADALAEAKGCFDAAAAEGLAEALAETQDERLKDLVERRLMYALAAAPAQQAGAAPSDDDLRKVYQDACDHADKLQQGFSYGRAQALRAVFRLGQQAGAPLPLAPTQDVTNDQIRSLWQTIDTGDIEDDIMSFARALLDSARPDALPASPQVVSWADPQNCWNKKDAQ